MNLWLQIAGLWTSPYNLCHNFVSFFFVLKKTYIAHKFINRNIWKALLIFFYMSGGLRGIHICRQGFWSENIFFPFLIMLWIIVHLLLMLFVIFYFHRKGCLYQCWRSTQKKRVFQRLLWLHLYVCVCV